MEFLDVSGIILKEVEGSSVDYSDESLVHEATATTNLGY